MTKLGHVVFYVRDLEGRKVEDADQLREIKEALHYQLPHREILQTHL